MGYGSRLIWPPMGNAFIFLCVVCLLAWQCGAAFGGVMGCSSLHSLESLAGEKCVCV